MYTILDFDVKGYGFSIGEQNMQTVMGWDPADIRKAFSVHLDNFLFNGVKTIHISSDETYQLSLEDGKIIYTSCKNLNCPYNLIFLVMYISCYVSYHFV